MEKESIKKLIALKSILTNKKIVELIWDSEMIDDVFKEHIHTLTNFKLYEEILDLCEKNDITIITYFDNDYPDNLRRISSPPIILYAKGNLNLLKKTGMAIVGTRDASKTSLDWAFEISKELSSKYVIISGGALGVDTNVHKGALENNGNTICVLGSGILNIYPKENKRIIEEIGKTGLIVSEVVPNKSGTRFDLLERNRLTSGLSSKVLIVATKENGGSMEQYKVAMSQNKTIMVPDLSLNLLPNEGIIKILKANKNVMVITSSEESVQIKKDSQKQLETFV